MESHLYNTGFSSEHLRTYRDARENSSKRFCKPHRMMLIYHNNSHDGITEYYQFLNADVPPEGISPRKEWNRDTRPLNFIDVNTIAEAFLHHAKRR